MRWLSKYKDDVIFVKRFIFLPWKFGYEWRWWETAYIRKQRYADCWLIKRWASREEYLEYKLEQVLANFHIDPEALANFNSGMSLVMPVNADGSAFMPVDKELHDYMEDNPR